MIAENHQKDINKCTPRLKGLDTHQKQQYLKRIDRYEWRDTKTFLFRLCKEYDITYRVVLNRLTNSYLPAYKMLDNLFDWFKSPGRTDGKVFKSHVDLLRETDNSEYQTKQAKERLRYAGINWIVAKAFGNPTSHYFIDIKVFASALAKIFDDYSISFFKRVFSFFTRKSTETNSSDPTKTNSEVSTKSFSRVSTKTKNINNIQPKQTIKTNIKEHVHDVDGLSNSFKGDVGDCEAKRSILDEFGLDENHKGKNYQKALEYSLTRLQEVAQYLRPAKDLGQINSPAGLFWHLLSTEKITEGVYKPKEGGYRKENTYTKFAKPDDFVKPLTPPRALNINGKIWTAQPEESQKTVAELEAAEEKTRQKKEYEQQLVKLEADHERLQARLEAVNSEVEAKTSAIGYFKNLGLEAQAKKNDDDALKLMGDCEKLENTIEQVESEIETLKNQLFSLRFGIEGVTA